MGGGYPNQGETVMRNHTQPPKKQKLQSVFNLAKSINGKKSVICTALTGEQAISLVNALKDELNNPLFIKFAGMEVAK